MKWKKLIFLLIILLEFTNGFSQYKRFSVEGNFALGYFDTKGPDYSNYTLSYMGYSGRIQYNFPWLFSINIGFGQEHQSYVNISKQDLPPGYNETSNIRTSELFVPMALRMTLGHKLCFYAEAGAQWNFKGRAAVDAYVEYWNEDPDHQNYSYSYKKSLDNPYAYYDKDKKWDYIRPFLGLGMCFPIFKGLHGCVEYRSQMIPQEEYFVKEEKLYLPNIFPYSRAKFSIGLSYYFNAKKDSQYQFKSIYLKPIKNTIE